MYDQICILWHVFCILYAHKKYLIFMAYGKLWQALVALRGVCGSSGLKFEFRLAAGSTALESGVAALNAPRRLSPNSAAASRRGQVLAGAPCILTL